MKYNQGFTLVEILVAVLIIATALLGLVGLQAAGVRNTVSSYNRTQASHFAYSMADRMRANVSEAKKGSSSKYITLLAANATAKANCKTTTGCTSVEMAENDLFEWNAELKDTTRGLVKTGTITYNAPVFTIAISWGENRDDNRDGTIDPDLTFQTDFQL